MLQKYRLDSGALGATWDPFPFVPQANIVEAVSLNLLWIVLILGWVASLKKYPSQTVGGGKPPLFFWIMGAIAWVVVFAISLSEFDLKYWLLGLSFANGALFSILSPALSVCFSLAMLIIRPWEIMTDNALALELPRFSIFFSIAWSLFYFILVDRFSIRMTRGVLFLLLYVVWAGLSTMVTPNPAVALAGFNESLFKAVILFFLIFHLTRDRFTVWAIKTTMIVAIGCMGIICYIFYINGFTETGRIVGFGLFGNSNDVGACMLIMIAFAITPFLKPSDLASKIIAAIPIFIGLVVLKLSQSRGSILSLLAMIGICVFMRMKRKLLAFGLIATMGLVGSTAMKFVIHRDSGDLEGSSENRMAFVIAGARMAFYHPVFGVGFNQFPYNYDAYSPSFEGGEYGLRTAHSTWVLALAESGFIGLMLFVAFYLFYGGRSAFRLYAEDPGWLCAFVAYTTAISFLSHTYLLLPYILMGSLFAASVVSTQNTPERYSS